MRLRTFFEGLKPDPEEGLSMWPTALEATDGQDDLLDVRRAFLEHAPRLLAFVERLGVSSGDAEDVVADTFLIAFRGRARFDNRRAVLPWLYGIAANLARKQRRRQWVRELFARTFFSPEEEPAKAERRLVEAEDQARVRTVLAAMPEKKRTILVLREFEELSTADIAEVLGIPEATVSSRLHYARKEFIRLYRQRLSLEAPE